MMNLPILLSCALAMLVALAYVQGSGEPVFFGDLGAIEGSWIVLSVLFFVLALFGLIWATSACAGAAAGSFLWWVGNEANRAGFEDHRGQRTAFVDSTKGGELGSARSAPWVSSRELN